MAAASAPATQSAWAGNAGGRLGAERDPQLARRRRDLLQERPRRRRRPIGIARRRPAGRIEEGGGIAHAPAHHMAAGETAPAFAHIGAGRVPCARRLEPDDAAIGRGNTDRAAAIGAVRHRHHARRDGRRGAAAGAARTVLQVPGIARRAVDHRLRRRVQTELRRVGAPEDYQPGALVTLDDGKIMVGDEAVIEMRPVPHPCSGVPGVDILQQERHARQRALRQSRLQSLPRLIVHLVHDGIQPGIQRLDPPDRSFQHFRRRNLLLGD